MIKDRIDISTIKIDMTVTRGTPTPEENWLLGRKWNAVKVGGVFKKTYLYELHVCIKVSHDWYIVLVWMGGTYMAVGKYWWPYN